MTTINFRKRILLFLLSTVLLTVSFYEDGWGIVEDSFYKYWQEVSEFFVIGRLVKSQQDGIFSGGMLLVIGDAADYDVTSKSIKHQYDAYSRGQGFTSYWTYKSTPAFEGIFYSIFDKYTEFSPGLNIKFFRLGVAISSAIVLALFLVWVEAQFGFLAFVLALLFASVSPWLILFGGHIYWQMWSFYLPFVAVLLMNNLSSKWVSIAVFIAVLLKTLFSGFEFITPVLVSITIPGVYYFIRDNWPIRYFLQWLIQVSLIGILATGVGLLVLLAQISGELGSMASGYLYILDALNRRSIGDPSDFTGVFADALNASVWKVINTYLSGPALALDGKFTGGIYTGAISYLELILAILFFSLLLMPVLLRLPASSIKNKSKALVITTWYSILAPMSWFVIFKAHSYIHINLSYFVWQLPFLLLGFVLIGWSISQAFIYIKTPGANGSGSPVKTAEN